MIGGPLEFEGVLGDETFIKGILSPDEDGDIGTGVVGFAIVRNW